MPLDRIRDVIQLARLVVELRLFIAERREAARAPMDDPVSAIDQPAVVQAHERFAHGARQLGRQRIRRTRPIGRRADRAELLQDHAARLGDERLGAPHERFPAKVEPRHPSPAMSFSTTFCVAMPA